MKKRLGWTVNTVQAPNVQIDPDRWMHANHDQKKHEMQNFPRHGRESGSFCFRLIKFV